MVLSGRRRKLKHANGNGNGNGKRSALPVGLQLDPDFYRVAPRGRGKDTAVIRPYAQHPWVYAATMALARAVSAVPLVIYEGARPRKRFAGVDLGAMIRLRTRAANSGEKKPAGEANGFVRLFDDPCPLLTRAQLWQATIVWLVQGGENFWVKVADSGKLASEADIPAEVWPQNPTVFEPVGEDGQPGTSSLTRMPAKWKVAAPGGGRFYEPGNLVHFKFYNPWNPVRGLAPIEPGGLALNSDQAASYFNLQFFRQGCDPGGIFAHPKALTPNQRKDFIDWVREQHAGAENAQKELLLENGVTFSWNPRSQKDAEFQSLRQYARDELLAVIGTAKGVLSITDSLNYATFLGQKRAFYETTVVPLLLDLEDALWSQMFRGVEGGRWWAEFDLSQIAALHDDLLGQVQVAQGLFGIGYSRDEINERLGLGFEPDPETDVRGGQPFGMSPVDMNEGEDAQDGTAQEGIAGVVAAGGAVADTALNGAQIQSLVDLAVKVQLGDLPAATAKAIVAAAFPSIDPAEAALIIDPAAQAAEAEKEAPEQSVASSSPPAPAAEDGQDAEPPRTLSQSLTRLILAERPKGLAGRIRMAISWRKVRRVTEAEVARVIKNYLRRLSEDQLRRLDEVKAGLAGEGLTKAQIDRVLFNRAKWDAELQRLMKPKYQGIAAGEAARVGRELGVPAIPVTDPAMLQLQAHRLGTLVVANKSIRKMVQDRMIKGVSEGLSIDDLRLDLKKRLEGIGGNVRALRIARTETGMMASAARYVGMERNKDMIQTRKWLHFQSEDPRETHAEEARGPGAPVGERYPVTGLLHPREFGGPADEVINCRCDEMAVLKDDDFSDLTAEEKAMLESG